MKTDRELLELAAKAAGVTGAYGKYQGDMYDPDCGQVGICVYTTGRGDPSYLWNPLIDDGDALRLAVKLGLAVIPYPIYAHPKHSVIVKQYDHRAVLREESDVVIDEIEVFGTDPMAATRRTIVRAAAIVWEKMK